MARDQDEEATDTEKPSLRQRLHEATGDRDAEAKALRDRAPDDVDEHDARVAVQRAHDESGAAVRPPPDDLARPEDAASIRDERAGE